MSEGIFPASAIAGQKDGREYMRERRHALVRGITFQENIPHCLLVTSGRGRENQMWVLNGTTHHSRYPPEVQKSSNRCETPHCGYVLLDVRQRAGANAAILRGAAANFIRPSLMGTERGPHRLFRCARSLGYGTQKRTALLVTERARK